MAAIDVPISLNRPQFSAHEAMGRRQTVFCGWGRGVGKSWFTRLEWWLRIAEWEHRQRPNCPKKLKGVRVLVLMPTLVQFKDVHWAEIESELLDDGPWAWLGGKLNSQRGQIDFPGGSWVKPFPASSYNSRTARGMRGDMLSGDEIDDIDANVYHSVAIPWLSEPWSLGEQLLGGTPTRGHHGLWYSMLKSGELAEAIRSGNLPREAALDTPEAVKIRGVLAGIRDADWPKSLPTDRADAALQILKSFHSFHATYRDAPETVDPLAVATARAEMSDAAFAREWEADPSAGEGLVFAFDEDFHVREVPAGLQFSEYVVGVDHGYRDPGVFLLAGVVGSGENSFLWVLDEIYRTDETPAWWVDQAVTWSAATSPNSEWVRDVTSHRGQVIYYCDPSRPEQIESLNARGIQAIPADNAIHAGIGTVANLMAIRSRENAEQTEQTRYSRLYVRPSCINLRRELGVYRWKRDPLKPGGYLEQPVGRDDHTIDCLRYLSVGRFGRGGGHQKQVYTR